MDEFVNKQNELTNHDGCAHCCEVNETEEN